MSSDYQKLQDQQNTNINSISSSYDDQNKQVVAKNNKSVVQAPAEVKAPEKPVNNKKALQQLYSYTWKYKGLLLWGQVGLLLTSLTTIALPYLCGEMIDAMTVKKDNDRLQEIAFYFIFVAVGNGVFSVLRGFCFNYLGERVVFDLKTELFNNFIRKDTQFYDSNKSGELISRITSDTTLIQSAASDNISILLRNLLQVIGSLILLWIMSWKLTIALLLCVPPTLISVAVFIKFYQRYTKLYQDQLAISNAIAVEVLGNIRIVQSFATEKKEGGNFSSSQKTALNIGQQRSILYGTFIGFVSTISFGSILTVIWYGGTLVLNGDLTSGELTSFVLYTITLSVGLLGVGGIFNNILTALSVADQLFEMMSVQTKIVSGSVKKPLNGNIVLSNVKFNYPSKEDVTVLKNININIQPGEVVALVGTSGSGQSSIVGLVQRFYDVNEGEILLDGENIKNYDNDFLHHNIGFVSQEPTLFSGTLYENIAYGVQGQVSDEKLKTAIDMANASEFIYNDQLFPLGLQTVVGERGIKLSGGQKQRIAIARALIKDPKILIFDEATSALDAESEYQVQRAIDGLMQVGQKTIIIIAHRLSTIINCDKILVLHHGEIAEQGTHQQLVSRDGRYQKLIERQLSSN